MKLKSLKIHGKNYPYNEDQSKVNYEGEWREVQEDQEGDLYIIYNGAMYLDEKEQLKDESKEVKEGGDWCYDGNESESYTLLYNGKPMVDISTGEDEAIELVSLLNEKEAQSKNMYYALKELVSYQREKGIFDEYNAYDAWKSDGFNELIRNIEEIIIKATPKK